METKINDINQKLFRPAEPELDLYTIPIQSSWFAWNDIHETEKVALREFFDGSSISRTPRIYKEYRDFIINKYRENPSRRLTFTEIRKSLVADVSLLSKVFKFLERWGLVNFGVPGRKDGEIPIEDKVKEKGTVRFEEGALNGVRVVAMPNSAKPIYVPLDGGIEGRQSVDNAQKFLPLASYSDIFGDTTKGKNLVCRKCGEICGFSYYESSKDNHTICTKCFQNGNLGESKSTDDFELIDSSESIGDNKVAWAEAETLSLLESVLKHGDNWELVAQSVQTKSKLDCIEKLIELPFGEFMLNSAQLVGSSGGTNGNTNSLNSLLSTPLELEGPQQKIHIKDQQPTQTNEIEQNGDDAEQASPSLKRKRLSLPADADSSLMKQVAHISTIVSSHITAAAGEAAVTAICEESSYPREIFDSEEDQTNIIARQSPRLHNETESCSAHQAEGSEMNNKHTLSEIQENPTKDGIPLTLQIRAATATAMGAAAAHAKLLADQEFREMESLVATIIDTQMKKLHCKLRRFEDLEVIMEKEYAEMEQLKECIVDERIDVLHNTFNAGTLKGRDHTDVKPPHTGNVS